MKAFYFFFGLFIGAISLLSLGLFVDLSFQKSLNEDHHHHHQNSHDEEVIAELGVDESRKFGIEIEKPAPKELGKSFSVRGKVTLPGNYLAHILPTISAVAVGSFKNIGDPVFENEILAVLESRQMAELKAEYIAKFKKEELLYNSMIREKNLFEKGIVSENDYLLALQAFEEAKIAKELARQKLKAYSIEDEEIESLILENEPNLRKFFIRSPLNGTVINRHITLGEYIEGSTPIFEIADLNLLWVEAPFSLKDLMHVKIGEIADIVFPYQNKPYKAEIVRISPVLQEESLSPIAILALENPNGEIKLGSFGKVHFQEEKKKIPLAISCSAIQGIEGKSCVFVKSGEHFEKREVKTGQTDGTYVEILSGINLEDEVAVGNTFILKADIGKHEAEHEH